jgi:hypothetical protein
MSSYDDRDTAIGRDPMRGGMAGPGVQGALPPQQQPYGYDYGYGYGVHPYDRRGMGRRMNLGGWSETKPFFMTSEFIFTLLTVIGICITAAIAADLDSHRASALVAGLVAAYTLSRGIAKSGTRSRATDPRDDMQFNRSHDGHSHEAHS